MRFKKGKDQPRYGWVLDNDSELKVGLVEGSPFAEFRRLEATQPFESVELLAPIVPTKIICVGRNYAAHALERQVDVPEIPLLFLKPPSSVIAPGKPIVLPPQSQQVEHEAELVVVISRRGRWIAPEQALNFVLGYTIGNDVTARDLQKRDGQWTRAKGFDTFCPLGPWIETEFDPADSLITCNVNDELRQMASTRDMVFSVRQLVAFTSSVMTLEEGDILMTGTPSGVSPLTAGDRVVITIEGIGSLENPVVGETAN
ncbi:MAG: 2-hydroxyhepta-2,4-diene-1,7-dioate isomerase [Chloroflexi bacterium RBG_16_54_18]|nr:MAG: 2-hydroxyhepta-2,4-diene-1,7-dioate isomerase [Chloroflexi bacterium RBG_16_54_18]